MNWQDRLDNIEFTIITGDGKEFKPLWRDAQFNIKFNSEGTDFVDISGTLIDRKKRQGRQFPLTFYFQGENHLDISREFNVSSADSRPWKITHPFYDEITAQPLSLNFDNTQYNVTKITGILWETLSEKFPTSEVLPRKEIQILKSVLDTNSALIYENLISPTPLSIEPAGIAVDSTEARYDTITITSEDATKLKDAANSASSAALEIIQNPLRYAQRTQDLINLPFTIENNISNKINAVVNAYNDLFTIFFADPISLEVQANTLISESCRIATDPSAEDYQNRNEVLDIIDKISSMYDDLITFYDSFPYNQNDENALNLDNIVNSALGNLFDIAFNAKQERTFLVEKDNNIVTLSHEFYGPGDDNLDRFIEQNEITLDEYLLVRKGRKIIYFV